MESTSPHFTDSISHTPKGVEQGPLLCASINPQTSQCTHRLRLRSSYRSETSFWGLVGGLHLLRDESPHQNELDPKHVQMQLFTKLCSQEWLKLWLSCAYTPIK